MSMNLSWMAIEGADEAAVLERLNLEVDEAPESDSEVYHLMQLPNGWLVIVSSEGREVFEYRAPLAAPDGFTLVSEMSETVMVSSTHAYRNGALEWSVVHDPEVDGHDVRVTGTPPPIFSEIYDELRAGQAAETEQVDHLFDAAWRLSQALSGFDPYDAGVGDWKTLRYRSTGRRGIPLQCSALRPAMNSELLPLILSTGWLLQEDLERTPKEPAWLQFKRRPYDRVERLAILFDDGEDIFIRFRFDVWENSLARKWLISADAPPPRPFWARWIEPRKSASPAKSREEQIAEVVGQACEDVVSIQKFLRGGGADPRLKIGGVARKTWPKLPLPRSM